MFHILTTHMPKPQTVHENFCNSMDAISCKFGQATPMSQYSGHRHNKTKIGSPNYIFYTIIISIFTPGSYDHFSTVLGQEIPRLLTHFLYYFTLINRHHQHAKSSLDWCRPIDLHAFLWLI
jgi:hypothetical protein